MKIKFFTIITALFIISNTFAQTNLNSYKYVIVPNKYDFLKEKDQYQLNSLTQFLFNKYGFEALMEGSNYPEDLIRNRCLALKSDVLKDSGLFKTKLSLELKDCNDAVVYTSQAGESREKEYNKAYSEALREAFEELEALNYSYKPDSNIAVTNSQEVKVQNEVVKEIQQLKAEIETLKQSKETQVSEKVEPKLEPKVNPVVEVPSVEVLVKQENKLKEGVKEMLSSVLYAQEIENGFQLVDSTPKVVYKIKSTGLDNVFLVEGQNATLYKKGDSWILEYYENNVLKQEELNIKF
jgi:hypothetical protein